MTPRRVLHCHSTFAPGGKELRAVRLMNAFGGAAHHVVLSGVPDALGARDAIAPDLIVDFPQDAPSLRGRPSWSRYRTLARYMQGFDLVLTYNWGAMDAVAARRFFPGDGPPLIHHEDGFNADEAHRQRLGRMLFRRAMLPAAAQIIVPSRQLYEIARALWKCPAAQLVQIPNGIDTRRFAAPAEMGQVPGFQRHTDDIVIGTIAGLRPVKNLARLIRAVAALPGPVRLVIVGEGPDRAALMEAAHKHGMADRLILPGHLPEPHRFIGHFDIFALSSDSEQAPLALIEAMAAGRPVVATLVGDVGHMVAPENLPWLVAPSDEAGFAAALQALCRDPDLRARLGRANQDKARAVYDEADMIQRYADIYGFADPKPADPRFSRGSG